MPFVNTNDLRVIERLPGWHGRYFHSDNMTFAHYDFTRGSSIHEHFHPEEEVYEVIEGELEVTIDGVAQIVRRRVGCNRAEQYPSLSKGPHRRAGHNRRPSSSARVRLGAVQVSPEHGFLVCLSRQLGAMACRAAQHLRFSSGGMVLPTHNLKSIPGIYIQYIRKLL